MKNRLAHVAAAALLALTLVACSNADGGEGSSPSPSPSVIPGWATGSTGATGATGATGGTDGSTSPTPAPVLQGTYEGSFLAGDAVFTLTGASCDIVAGAWEGTVTASGGASGSGSFTFEIPEGKDSGKTAWSFEGTFDGAASSFEQEGTVSKGGPSDLPSLQFFGTLTVRTGGDELKGPANVTTDVALGPVATCG